MNTVIVDSNVNDSAALKRALGKIDEIKSTVCFDNTDDALRHIKANSADIVFSEIETESTDGIELAIELLGLENSPSVVFVTSCRDRALDAWDVEAIDYILKPFKQQQIEKAVYKAKIMSPKTPAERKIEIRCFPNFDLRVNGNSIPFRNKKARELLAYLVHCNGDWVDMNKIIFDLLEEQPESVAKNYYRSIVYRLKKILTSYNIQDIFETGFGKCRVNTSGFICDYYRYCKGDKSIFVDGYMSEYSWAEQRAALIVNQSIRS